MLTRKMQGDNMLFYDGEKLILTVEETDMEGGGVLMTLKGSLTSETAHHIQDELEAFATVGEKVAVDFKDVTFITSSVLMGFLKAQQTVDAFRKGEMLLKNVPDFVYRQMEEIGIAELLVIEE